MNQRGIFITLEGGEGSGKSTQITRLADTLRAQRREVVTTREPGGTPEAESIRALLTRRNGGNWTPVAETLLFFAARAMHVQTLIRPALTAGNIVICDRFTDSTRAYQSFGHGLGRHLIEDLVRLTLEGFEPDLTFILDIDPRTGLTRAKGRMEDSSAAEDRFERLDTSFHEKLRRGYLEIAKENPQRCVVVDAARSVDEIAGVLAAVTAERLSHV